MKKFLLLIAATALAGTTYAQSITFKKDWGADSFCSKST